MPSSETRAQALERHEGGNAASVVYVRGDGSLVLATTEGSVSISARAVVMLARTLNAEVAKRIRNATAPREWVDCWAEELGQKEPPG